MGERARHLSLRTRLTLLATVVVALGLAAGSVLLTATVSRSMRDTLDSSALTTADEVADLIDAGQLPTVLRVGGQATAAVQVVDAQYRVRAYSPTADALVPLLVGDQLRRVRGGDPVVLDGDRAGGDAPLRVVGVASGTPEDPLTVLVAVDVGSVRDAVKLVRKYVILGAPVLLGLLVLLSWQVIGATLRPVEALRRGAENITGAGGLERLPVPAGRDEIARLATTLNDMLARIDAAGARQRAFVSDAAHELRSPLASLRTQLEVAEQLDEPGAELAREVLIDADRLGRLINDLLLLARLDEAPRRRRRESIDLCTLVDAVTERYSAARVPVTVAPADGPCEVLADTDGVRRVVANLLDNAVRHAASGVRVAVTSVEGSARLTVTDDGPGIPAADREKVFDRFTRLDEARSRDSGGAGLGLAIARGLITAHDGTITLSDAAPGLRVTVTLPLSS